MRKSILALLLAVSTIVAPAGVGAIESGESTTGAVWGTVTNADTGAPIIDICVTLHGSEGPLEKTGWTNHNGVYEIGSVPAGSYDILFSDCELGRFEAVGGVAVVTGDHATEKNAAMSVKPGFGGITGSTTDGATQDPVAGMCVKLYLAEDDIYVTHTLTGQDGAYELVAEAGTYRVRFKPCEGNNYYEQWWNGADGWEGSSTVTITSGSFTSGVNAILEPAPEEDSVVWGYVVDGATGDGVVGYCVAALSGESYVSTVLTGEMGGWEMHLAPGAYRFKTYACEGHEDLGLVWYLDAEEYEHAKVVEIGSGWEKQLDTLIVGDIRFRDAIESNYHEDIVWLAESGITLGCDAKGTEFCPEEQVTRAQMAAFLHRALGEILAGGDTSDIHFDDVEAGSTFEEDIKWLASVGVTVGCNVEGTEFCPDEKVTRAQMAAFLHRALADVLSPMATLSGAEDRFSDDDGSQFEDDIEWLASVGVTGGCTADGTQFCPDDGVIREHMAAFLHRALAES